MMGYWRQRILNILQSVLLISGMLGLSAVIGWLVFGDGLVLMIGTMALVGAWMAGRVAPTWVFRLYRGVPLVPHSSPELYRLVQQLACRAGLDHLPQLYYLPSHSLNAFAVGTGRRAAIGITAGILERFPTDEIAGVLAHEIAHIKHRDTIVMGLADGLSRITSVLAQVGLLLMVLNLPAILFGSVMIPWPIVGLLILAPTLSSVLQMGLSRIREFEADAEAVRLTGRPGALARALRRLEGETFSLFHLLFPRRRRDPELSLLRTHPPLEERIKRLEELERPLTMNPVRSTQWRPDARSSQIGAYPSIRMQPFASVYVKGEPKRGLAKQPKSSTVFSY